MSMVLAAAIHMSPLGRQYLEAEESCKLVAYADSRGIPTIGIGHTGLVRGAPIVPDVTKATQAECDAWLVADLRDAEFAVQTAVNSRSPLGVMQNEIDALISFVFNEGGTRFLQSSVHAAFVAGNDHLVPWELLQYTRSGADAFILATRRARESIIYARGAYFTNSNHLIGVMPPATQAVASIPTIK